MERKVHRERFSGERSHKERAPMEQQYVQQYTGGPLRWMASEDPCAAWCSANV